MIGLQPYKLAALRYDILDMKSEVDEAWTMLERVKEHENVRKETSYQQRTFNYLSVSLTFAAPFELKL